MFTPMLRTMSASASDERGEAWPTTCKATSQLYASASLPALRTRANPPVPTPPKPRLPTPSTSRPTLDLELPKIPKGMSQSKSLSALSLVANRRQEQLQGILNRSASLGQVLLEESAPVARLLASSNSERAFQKVSDEIGRLQKASVSIYGEETPADKAAAAAARQAAFEAANPEVVARKKEEVRKRRQAQLQEMLKKSGRASSGHHEAVQRKLERTAYPEH